MNSSRPNNSVRTLSIAFAALLALPAGAQVTYDPASLAAAKARVKASDAVIKPAYDALLMP